MITIIGGGLAGCEAAWQIASRGVRCAIFEMRPVHPTAVHQTDRLAELVCSNSFRGDKLDNAVGLLKEEMRRLGSLVMRAADANRVPAGAALAVDRDGFARQVTDAIATHPLITLRREEVARIPERGDAPTIIATGPLTSDALSAEIARLVGADHLYFFDAISPIVHAESLDHSKVFRASRWDRSFRTAGGSARASSADLKAGATEAGSRPRGGGTGLQPGLRRGPSFDQRAGADQALRASESCPAPDDPEQSDGDYLNCPLTKEEYERFYDALTHAESATIHDFDSAKFFEGCLPIEVMAHRGKDTLRFGPMKPVGLTDPRTGRYPYAVVQLRQDTLAGDHFSLVGFQTQIKWGEQARVLRLIPGLEHAEFVRYGMVHRNTYINGPTVLLPTWQTRMRADLFFAGQVSGVEGYVESAASGLIAGINAARLASGVEPVAAPQTTAIGALGHYVSHADSRYYDPTNITFGIMPPLAEPPRDKLARKTAVADRALGDLEKWMQGTENVCERSA